LHVVVVEYWLILVEIVDVLDRCCTGARGHTRDTWYRRRCQRRSEKTSLRRWCGGRPRRFLFVVPSEPRNEVHNKSAGGWCLFGKSV